MTWELIDKPEGWVMEERLTHSEQVAEMKREPTADEMRERGHPDSRTKPWGTYWEESGDGRLYEAEFRSLAHIVEWGEAHPIEVGAPLGLRRPPDGANCWRAIYSRLDGTYDEAHQTAEVESLTDVLDDKAVPSIVRAQQELELMAISPELAAAIERYIAEVSVNA